jgi:Phage integrase, N-terminal SAM-like domain
MIPSALQEFEAALGARDPKTVATYLTTMRGFVAWLAIQPGGAPFHLRLVTETAVRGYMDSLQSAGRAPRTRSKALSALRCFCQWAVYDTKSKRRLYEILNAQGMQMNQQITFLSDGGDDVRTLQLYLSPFAEHLLDWFHITMRLTILGQLAKGAVLRSESKDKRKRVAHM